MINRMLLFVAFLLMGTALTHAQNPIEEAMKSVPTVDQVKSLNMGDPNPVKGNLTVGCVDADTLLKYADAVTSALQVITPAKAFDRSNTSDISIVLQRLSADRAVLDSEFEQCGISQLDQYMNAQVSDTERRAMATKMKLTDETAELLDFVAATRFASEDASYLTGGALPKDVTQKLPSCAGANEFDSQVGALLELTEYRDPSFEEVDPLFHDAAVESHCAEALSTHGYDGLSARLWRDLAAIDLKEWEAQARSDEVLIKNLRNIPRPAERTEKLQPIIVQAGPRSCSGTVIGNFINWDCQ